MLHGLVFFSSEVKWSGELFLVIFWLQVVIRVSVDVKSYVLWFSFQSLSCCYTKYFLLFIESVLEFLSQSYDNKTP